MPEEERRVAEPIRELSAHTEIVKLLLTKEQEARITEASNVASAEFIDLAVPGVERSGPSIPLHLLFGALLGVIAGLGLALGMFFAADTVDFELNDRLVDEIVELLVGPESPPDPDFAARNGC